MFEALITLIITTALLLGSPGPAPLALAATGATFGIRQGMPFLIGILIGLSFAIVGAALGLAALFMTFPEVRVTVQILGGIYMLYVAYKIATAPVLKTNNQVNQQAPKLVDGFILNLLNPKAYAAFFAIFSQFLLPFADNSSSLTVTGLVCLVVATIVDFVWLCLGGALRPVFEKPKSARMLRVAFAIMMLVAVIIVINKSIF